MVEDTATRDVMVDLNNSGVDGDARAVLDEACMAELRALDPDGKAQLVRRVLAAYQASLAKQLAQMRASRAAGDWEQVARAAHTLKSSSASVGALALSALCADIERQVREGDAAAVAPRLDAFDREVLRVDAAVARLLGEPEAAA
jgi:HPt (histidine-containing phosphotransfer) domain-containing protein